ncbi:HNH endonuclease signature motif containing protein [Subtercola lobariae]|nr:HNH endonuclease signature motif containing protein [Subtercola lobariae]
MNETASSLVSQGDGMRALIDDIEVLFGCRSAAPNGLADSPVAGLSDEDALTGLVLVERLGKLVDALRVEFASTVDARCEVTRGDDRLTVRLGFATVQKLLAAHTGTSVSTASDRVRLGRRIRTDMSLAGVPNPSRFPRVEEALRTGVLGVDTAEVITRKLSQVAKTTGYTEELGAAEEYLVAAAAQSAGGLGFSADEVGVLAGNLRDRLDPDGVEPRDACLTEQRSLRFITLPSGMVKMIGLLPPEDAASWLAIDAATQSPRVRPSFRADPADTDPDGGATATRRSGGDTGSARATVAADTAAGNDHGDDDEAVEPPIDPVFEDPRTRDQKCLDVFTDVIRRGATLPEVPRINGAAAVVSVHADLDDIVAGRGVGWVPGITEPLPASAVQQLLCHADSMTTVFGEGGQVLCQGKKQRLFTTRQIQAMAARDGGCVWPGCDRPPSWCESHHTTPWTSQGYLPGRTDVDLGVLLCHFHHSVVHKTGWTLTMISGAPHFIPPDCLDWTRTPRPATQQRTRTRLKPLKLGDLPKRTEPWHRTPSSTSTASGGGDRS